MLPEPAVPEYWTTYPAAPKRAVDCARQAEALGWDGLGTVDSQNLSGDPYVFLALAATGSTRLGVQTAVTNVVTRHPAVTATSALTVQSVSGGRMVLGIGRGDSALAHLGRAPAKLKWFEQYLATLQAYLRGESVPFADARIPDHVAPPVETLQLAHAPEASRIGWARNTPKVPVEVASTGAKVIAIAARHAERVMFALGAVPERIQWGMRIAREAAAAAGRDPATLKFGAYVSVVCHDDMAIARELGKAGTGLFARFSVMHGQVSGPTDAVQDAVFRTIHTTYDMTRHAQAGGQQTLALTDEFMDGFAIIGSADHCVRRLAELEALGLDKFLVTGPNFMAREPEAQVAAAKFTGEVLPRLRQARP